MEVPKVAIVTGANKGIGFAIAKGLCQNFQGIVYLTARSVTRGQIAVKVLENEGLTPNFHQLDIDDKESINRLADYTKTKYGGFDLLVNNAGIGFSDKATEPLAVQVKKTIDTNYFGTLHVCEALFPLLRRNARVVNMSSSQGHLSYIPHANIRNQLANLEMSVSELSKLMRLYLSDCKEAENEWTFNCYIVSKVGITALTRIQQVQFDKETPNRNIFANSVHPGYVDTDLTEHEGPLTIEEGARAPLFLCLEPHNLRGQYVWLNSSVVDWLAPSHPDED